MVASSALNKPHRISWAHRTGDPRAPIVTITDCQAGSSTDILYAGGRAVSLSSHSLQAHGGANMFVREMQPCVLFGWSAYGECSRQWFLQKRTRRVREPALFGGAGCDALEEVAPLPPWIESHGCGPVPTVMLLFEEMPTCSGSCARMVGRATFSSMLILLLSDCL